MPSLWDNIKKRTIETKVRRAIVMANNPTSFDGTKNDYSIRYPADVRNAANKNFIDLKKRVIDETKKQHERSKERSDKLNVK